MDTSLREQFDRAVAGDPGLDPGEMAHTAIAEGGRIRRRRKRMVAAAGLAGVLGAVTGLLLLTAAPRSEHPPAPPAAAMLPVAAPSCSATPVDRDATDVLILLTGDATDQQRSALKSALGDDRRVKTLFFESRQDAYGRFLDLWARTPEVVPVGSAGQFPESYRLRLADASQYAAFRAQYAAMGGVGQVIGRICPPSAPVGGVR